MLYQCYLFGCSKVYEMNKYLLVVTSFFQLLLAPHMEKNWKLSGVGRADCFIGSGSTTGSMSGVFPSALSKRSISMCESAWSQCKERLEITALASLEQKVQMRNKIRSDKSLEGVELAEVCEVVIELYYQEVWLVLDNIYIYIYANMLSAYPRD